MKLTAKLMIPRALLRSPVATEARCSGLPQDGASVRSQAARKHSKPGIFGALARRIAMASVGATFGLDANASQASPITGSFGR